MAYNKKNYYKRIMEIQEITNIQRHQYGLSYKEIYWAYIEPKYFISKKTYHTYLGIPAKRELKKIIENENNY
ncbi:hypothetical protein [Riemerella columbipharyngis]|uniref:Uncharacterized protein n=1 Tax=Riemerella columbipharyngis TaxID=1071918 RepID=A0A1G7FHS2_9FLAO|nr:hypothetical protein [Riemerella columbipharyngis]SDE75402.1 hypothetical protein SAMN05421544_1234 [Riemerella columbipharyngis]